MSKGIYSSDIKRISTNGSLDKRLNTYFDIIYVIIIKKREAFIMHLNIQIKANELKIFIDKIDSNLKEKV